jgi:hypothetical protein
MPVKKPSQEKIESVKTRFQVVESKVLDSNKEKFFKLPYGTALEAIAQIQQRLKLELGGQVGVVTAVGRIDVLTDTELIEIKDIQDWKNALGQILAYSSFFSGHSKRIHLFGQSDLAKLALAQATCSEFDITVTFEEVQ